MLTDEFKDGHPKSVVVPQNVDAVRELITRDRHVTFGEIKTSVSLSESWIYTYDPKAKQQSTVWVFQDEPKKK
ncbi:hypothetical protein EVAR_63369_1 [Eumeta japonica]|uniref:Histone-lysine N-methyltransferase SETMAR n=1 Tax=Eumeta variegata TaxID=151549 RepID=A0A4C2A2E8_EUMVA|nr:hypothetical protein EVAR_63369_1 [Eumeta japonica]